MRAGAIGAVLFDLDGTLVDSSAGIRRCADATLTTYGLAPLGPDTLPRFIGPPLRESFATVGAPGHLLDDLVATYRKHYADGGIHEFTVYPGIPELLAELAARDLPVGVATSKLTASAEIVVAAAGLGDLLAFVVGAEPDGRRSTKAEVVTTALSMLEPPAAARAVMVGDREHDGEGARAAGIGFVGVAWGFGDREQLRAAGASTVVSTPSELRSVLLERRA